VSRRYRTNAIKKRKCKQTQEKKLLNSSLKLAEKKLSQEYGKVIKRLANLIKNVNPSLDRHEIRLRDYKTEETRANFDQRY